MRRTSIATVAACREFDAPVLSRGAATSLAGQCCNTAVILDFSRYMRRIARARSRRRAPRIVEPGIVLDRVREAAEQFDLTFAPDPATHSRCTLGGMIGNNSCGTHSLLGGKTVDNIESHGHPALRRHAHDRWRDQRRGTARDHRRGRTQGRDLRRPARPLRDRYAPLIRERFPRIPRRVSGFNLDELLPENGFHVARALVGSEGTCVTVLEVHAAAGAQPAVPHAGRPRLCGYVSSRRMLCR